MYDALNAEERGGIGPNGKPSLTIDEAANQLIRGEPGWGLMGQAITITYAFRASAPATMPEDTAGFSVLSSQQIAAVEAALRLWSSVANISFQRVGSGTSGAAAYSDDATILFGNYSSGATGAAAFAFYPGNLAFGSASGDVWINSMLRSNSFVINQNDSGFRTLLHEIGHAIGIAHPADYDASDGTAPTYANSAEYFEDSTEYTVMSYFSLTNTGGSSAGLAAPGGPLIDDIAAAQMMYGANRFSALGDTSYGWYYGTLNEFGSRGPQPENYLLSSRDTTTIWGSVWDAGGEDTFDFSHATVAQTINLNPGAFSNVLGAVGTLSIAQGTIIENAIGGSGADRIIGNAVANILRGGGGADSIEGGGGDDIVEGGGGDDTMAGGSGGDIFRLTAGGGSDRITDLDADDRFEVPGGVFTALSEVQGDTLLAHAGGSVRIAGVTGRSLGDWNRLVLGEPVTGTQPLWTLPRDDANQVPVEADIRIGYLGWASERQGSITLARADGTVVERFDVASSPRIDTQASIITIDPTLPLDPGTRYTLTISAGAFAAGNSISGQFAEYAFTTAGAPAALPAFIQALGGGAAVTLGGAGSIFGGAGAQQVSLLDLPGTVAFDGSFSGGGDRIVLAGDAADWTVARSASTAVLSDGDSTVRVPFGIGGVEIAFADGVRVLRFDLDTAGYVLGAQVVTGLAQAVTAAGTPTGALAGLDAAVGGVLVTGAGGSVILSGSQAVFGTASAESVRVLAGSSVQLDGSFNLGGDAVSLPGHVGEWQAVRSGSSLVLSRGADRISMPMGPEALTLRFDDDDRSARFDTAANAIRVGDQTVGGSAVALSAITQTAIHLADTQMLSRFDAGTGDFAIDALPQYVQIDRFGRGDTLTLPFRSSGQIFANEDGDIRIISTDGNRLYTVLLTDVADPSMPVDSLATARLAMGFDGLILAP